MICRRWRGNRSGLSLLIGPTEPVANETTADAVAAFFVRTYLRRIALRHFEKKPIGRGNPLPFAAVPHAVFNDRRLKPGDRDLLAALTSYARNKSFCWPSNRKLADHLGVAPRTIQYRLRHLEAAGWITSVQKPRQRVIHLTWKGEADCSPPVQSIARPPMKRVALQEEQSLNSTDAILG